MTRCPLHHRVLPLALLALTGVLGLWGLTGCNDVTRFSTEADESYCGNIVQGRFVRSGFGPAVRMRMTFDADRIDSQPGVLSTKDLNDNTELFKDAPLRAIPQLANDPLSTLQFGEGRSRNLLAAVTPSDGQTAFAVVSLLENGNVEVRILRGAPPPAGVTAIPAHEPPTLFGVFPLTRQRSRCGF